MNRNSFVGGGTRARGALGLALAITALGGACGGGAGANDGGGGAGTDLVEELPLGDLGAADAKADGEWGAALTCKPPLDLPALPKPRIVFSIEGLTLRLVDESVGFEKVFPVGVGAIDRDETQLTFGESLSMYPVLYYGRQDFEIRPSSIQECKTWWTDSETGERVPVFAGLPFLSWSGAYAFHGPIDNYRAENGGTLRRGFVSHGCGRLQAADILELHARIRGVARVPVRVQREPERRPDGSRVDVASPWFGADCETDAQCSGIRGGACHRNPYTGRGFCTASCTTTCPDRAGAPTSMCVADPDKPSRGICVPRETASNPECRGLDHLRARRQNRFNSRTYFASVCMPGTRGEIGDRCVADDECAAEGVCKGLSAQGAGVCSLGCTALCPDAAGVPQTTCVDDAELGAGVCLRRCSASSNGSECPGATACVSRPRAASAPRSGSATRAVCEP